MAGFKKMIKKFLGFEEEIDQEEELQQVPLFDHNEKKNQVHNDYVREEITLYPKTFADACEVVEQLDLGYVVVVNMNDLDLDTCKRISDFVLGAIYVMQGDVEKISKRVFRFWINE